MPAFRHRSAKTRPKFTAAERSLPLKYNLRYVRTITTLLKTKFCSCVRKLQVCSSYKYFWLPTSPLTFLLLLKFISLGSAAKIISSKPVYHCVLKLPFILKLFEIKSWIIEHVLSLRVFNFLRSFFYPTNKL